MTDISNETAMLLGEFRAQIASLTEAVREQGKKSDDRGARMYRELEQIRMDQLESKRDIQEMKGKLEEETGKLKARLDEAEPTLTEINRWRERLVGMMILIGILSSLVTGAVTLFWKWVSAKIGIS